MTFTSRLSARPSLTLALSAAVTVSTLVVGCSDDAGTAQNTAGSSGATSTGGCTAGTASPGGSASAGTATAGSTSAGTSAGGTASGGGGGVATAGTGGSGGSAGGGGGGSAGHGGGSGGGSANPALDAACTPTFTLKLTDKGPNGQLFLSAVSKQPAPNNEPEAFVQDIGRTVCRILYRTAAEVRPANHITLEIHDYDGVAAKSGDVGDINVEISSRYLSTVGEARIADEVKGILLHEMTHMYQNDDKPEAKSPYLPGMYEGIGDFVRIRAGHSPNGAEPNDKSGHWYDKAYTSQAFFWLYVDTKYPDFVYKLNASMKNDGVPWSETSIQTITGKSGDALWTAYQGAACCSGNNTSCCL